MTAPVSARDTPQCERPRGGRAVAWVGFVFGSVMSTAANVLYTWIPHPPEGAPPGWTPPEDWHPTAAAQIGAAVWPIALLLSVEVLSRVLWPSGWLWAVARFGGAGVVALGSAAISYGHLYGVLDAWHYGGLGAAVGPLVIDGLMVVAGFALLAPPAAGDEAAVESAARNSKSRPGRVEPPAPAPDVPNTPADMPTGMPAGIPVPAAVSKPKRERTDAEKRAAAERSARSRRHKAGDHTLCDPKRCPDARRVRAA